MLLVRLLYISDFPVEQYFWSRLVHSFYPMCERYHNIKGVSISRCDCFFTKWYMRLLKISKFRSYFERGLEFRLQLKIVYMDSFILFDLLLSKIILFSILKYQIQSPVITFFHSLCMNVCMSFMILHMLTPPVLQLVGFCHFSQKRRCGKAPLRLFRRLSLWISSRSLTSSLYFSLSTPMRPCTHTYRYLLIHTYEHKYARTDGAQVQPQLQSFDVQCS